MADQPSVWIGWSAKYTDDHCARIEQRLTCSASNDSAPSQIVSIVPEIIRHYTYYTSNQPKQNWEPILTFYYIQNVKIKNNFQISFLHFVKCTCIETKKGEKYYYKKVYRTGVMKTSTYNKLIFMGSQYVNHNVTRIHLGHQIEGGWCHVKA